MKNTTSNLKELIFKEIYRLDLKENRLDLKENEDQSKAHLINNILKPMTRLIDKYDNILRILKYRDPRNLLDIDFVDEQIKKSSSKYSIYQSDGTLDESKICDDGHGNTHNE